MSQYNVVLLEVGLIALLAMSIGMAAGAWIRSFKARRELAVFNGELRRTQSRLRGVDRARVASGRSGYGAASRRRVRQADDMRAMAVHVDDARDTVTPIRPAARSMVG
jgi:hypothetical protein